MYVKNSIPAIEVQQTRNLMSLPGVALTYLVAISLLSVVYTGPNSSNENNLNLFEMLHDISLNNPSHLLIVGDFNWTD